MSSPHDDDLLLKWGHEAAVLALVVGVVFGIATVVRAAMQEQNLESSAGRGLMAVGVGALVAVGIIWLRKRRERAIRPKWMGTTTAWRDEIRTKTSSDSPTDPS